MHPKELNHYDALNLEGGLLGTYRDHGFKLRHLPWDDPAHRSQSQLASFNSELERIQQEALNAFDALPKPVLLHCSAGIDRSSPVAAFIATQRSQVQRAG
jgi:protein-tyrosine phosphatase